MRAENLAFIPPTGHVVCGEDVVPIHQIASTRGINVMRGIDVETTVLPYVR